MKASRPAIVPPLSEGKYRSELSPESERGPPARLRAESGWSA